METNTALYKDLINEFNTRIKNTHEQIDLLEPLAAKMQSNTIQRLLKNWAFWFLEILSWLFVIICLAAAIFTNYLPPFNGIAQFVNSKDAVGNIGQIEMGNALIIARIMAAIIALLFFIISRMLASMRHKNSILALSAKNIKKVAEQLLRDRTAFLNLTEKYPYDLPLQNDTVIAPVKPIISDNHDVLL